MYVAHLTLHNFRSYSDLDLELPSGPVSFVGSNGQGKTNIVEAIDYLARLGSHRVAADAALVRAGEQQAVVRAAVDKAGRRAVLEVEINPGRSNRAKVNRAALPRARELVGLLRSVVFSPEDLALVKGDPSERRRFLDDLLVLLTPRYAGTKADYDRVLKQRNSLLKTARVTGRSSAAIDTLAVWDANLARLGAEIIQRRFAAVTALLPEVATAYAAVAKGARVDDAGLTYRSVVSQVGPESSVPDIEAAMLSDLEHRRNDELDRAITLVGPHRDDLLLNLGPLPVKGYASHGESWSFALALRLASYEVLKADGDDPILILDDVFAELDVTRRDHLATLVVDAEQVLVTAAVADDVPEALAGTRFVVADGSVTRVG